VAVSVKENKLNSKRIVKMDYKIIFTVIHNAVFSLLYDELFF